MTKPHNWNLYSACMCAEGVDGFQAKTPAEYLSAFAFIVRGQHHLKLQGWYGRVAADLIAEGLLTTSGEVCAAGHVDAHPATA